MDTTPSISVTVVEGILTDIQADVFVNSSNTTLKLHVGALSKSLANLAGEQLQQECTKNYPKGISPGEVAVTNGYHLKCKKVYHGALSSLQMLGIIDPIETLCKFVCACLQRAHDDNMASIAFPPLGCGFLDYPPAVSAQTMFQCFAMFESSHPQTTLQSIQIVIFPKEGDMEHVKHVFLSQLNTAPYKGKRQRHTEDISIFPKQTQHAEVSASSEKSYTRKPTSNSCEKMLKCGHACAGYTQETSCPPCLEKGCTFNQQQKGEDDCVICYTDELFAAPVIALRCGHVFHLHCTKRVLETKWVGARITFSFTMCPICKQPMELPELEQLLTPIRALEHDVKRKSLMRIQYEGLDKSEAVTQPTGAYYRDPQRMAMERYCYYPCYKCGTAYFGGTVQCEAGVEDRDFDLKDLVCAACSSSQREQVCPTHGTDFIEYKCRYCCSVAIFFCHGDTHYCNTCHLNNGKMRGMPQHQLPKCPAGPSGVQLAGQCPLNIVHPPCGTEFSLGCGICANVGTF